MGVASKMFNRLSHVSMISLCFPVSAMSKWCIEMTLCFDVDYSHAAPRFTANSFARVYDSDTSCNVLSSLKLLEPWRSLSQHKKSSEGLFANKFVGRSIRGRLLRGWTVV